MNAIVDETLVEKARTLGPVIREHTEAAERERRLSKPVIEALNRAGLTRMAVPKSLGGLETDPVTMLRVVEEIARVDSIPAWLLMVANGGSIIASRLPAATVEQLFADPSDCLIASAFQPPVAAREVAGGYRLTGRRALSSYAHAARWMCLTGVVMDGEQPRITSGAPTMIIALMPTKDVEVLDTWHALGLRGSDSADVEVQDLFVPLTFTCPLVPAFEPNKHYLAPLYKLPMLASIVLATIPPTAIAVARNAIEEVCAMATKRTPLASAVPLRDRGVAQSQIGRAEAMLSAARALMYETMVETWTRTKAGETLTVEQRTRVLMAATHAVQVAAEVTNMMFTCGGSSAVFSRHPLERLFRDSQVMRQHGFVAASRYETMAQVMLGLPPDFPLVFF